MTNEEKKEIYIKLLKQTADAFEVRFLCPMYLVGSFIQDGVQALDIDIVMPMTLDRIIRTFGSLDINERRYRFQRKQKLWLEKCITDMDIDFKVQLKEDFDKITGERIKLGSFVEKPE